MGKHATSVISYANGCYYHLWTEDHQSSIVCKLWVMRIICNLWVINHKGEFWDFRRAEILRQGHKAIYPKPSDNTTLSVDLPLPLHTAPCPMPWSPVIYSINKPWAGPRRRIMGHLEVTRKENRYLWITNGDRDKNGKALRNLDKGLSKHVQNWIHFVLLGMLSTRL